MNAGPSSLGRRAVAAVRALWRRSRGLALIGPALRAADRVVWFRAVRRSGLMDADFYAAQRGWRRAGPARATMDYVTRGFRAGVSPNPLFDELYAGRGLPDSDRVPALYAYLVSDRATAPVHPWWSMADYRERHDLDGSVGALEHAWERRAGARLTVRVNDAGVDVDVDGWRSAAMRAVAGGTIGARPQEPVRAALIRALQRADRHSDLKIAAAMRTADSHVHVVGIDPEPSTWAGVGVAALAFPDGGLTAVRYPRGTRYVEILADAARNAHTEVVVVTDPRAHVTADQFARLTELGADGPVAPVELDENGTIGAVGAAVVPVQQRSVRVALLRGHPREDLERFAHAVLDVPLLTGRTVALPTRMLVEALERPLPTGFELEALGLRLSRTAAPRVDTATAVGRFAPDSAFRPARSPLPPELDARDDRTEAERIIAAAGFAVQEWGRSVGDPAPLLRRRDSRLRWAIKTSAPAGPAGDVWGDTHFAQGLAAALRRRGHEVVIDAFPAANRASSYLDDVHLVVRGPFRITPPRSGVRIEWIISHPDEITRAEAAEFDLRFAVSPGWSARTSERWGLSVEPLLEATDRDKFYPRGVERTGEVVFVGTARGIPRPSVVAPLAAGVDVRVYGPDWRGFIPAQAIAAPTIANEDLSERYESASVVLNDQWPAMRREGFMAMRPFDVVAAGGRVVSEHITGLAEIFRGALVEYEDEAELVRLLRGDLDARFPSQDELSEIAAYVRAEHSFDARSAVLERAVWNFAGAVT
ncbi:glycosyltransferase [Microbacterium capsulatum]|uniref:Glycosyltransferase n=1 Tax=Microbacterium capsulatum TaxID=3041921 RepID=A0ABU0XJQ9_9MICO|nr:glycosyltransferase [Microbacterium sp. ASV81]MDQ4215372.1 glycosyltransferase [Microbacterium sp. ASV81]